MPLTGREKATIFLSILGAETSSRILRYLPDELADLIASGINHLPSPSPEALSEVMGEFQSLLALPASSTAPVEPVEEEEPEPPPKRNYTSLTYERPQMTAFLLSLLPEEEQQEALHALPREKGLVKELLARLRKNPLTPQLENRLKEQYKDKLFL